MVFGAEVRPCLQQGFKLQSVGKFGMVEQTFDDFSGVYGCSYIITYVLFGFTWQRK